MQSVTLSMSLLICIFGWHLILSIDILIIFGFRWRFSLNSILYESFPFSVALCLYHLSSNTVFCLMQLFWLYPPSLAILPSSQGFYISCGYLQTGIWVQLRKHWQTTEHSCCLVSHKAGTSWVIHGALIEIPICEQTNDLELGGSADVSETFLFCRVKRRKTLENIMIARNIRQRWGRNDGLQWWHEECYH